MLLSIIIPVYNGEKYIERCIQSIVKCNSNEIEAIIIDDGSTDTTEIKCSTICEADERIRYYKQKNAGVSKARNTGLSIAKGHYIMFLDSDDFLEDGWWHICKDAIDKAIHMNAELCVFDYYRSVSNNKIRMKIFDSDISQVSREKLLETYIYTDLLNMSWGKLFEKNFLTNNDVIFPVGVKRGEDTIFVGRAIKEIKHCLYVNKPILIYYYDNLESAMHAPIKDFKDRELVFNLKRDMLITYCEEYGLSAIKFYKKFFGDFISIIRRIAFEESYAEFKQKCNEAHTYEYVKEFLYYCDALKGTKLGLRRMIQRICFKNGWYLALYIELMMENYVSKVSDRIK